MLKAKCTKKSVVFAMIACMFISMFSLFAVQPTYDVEAAQTDVTPLTSTESKKVLFIGNSITFFNNSPEMYQSLVKAGTGKTVKPIICVYSKKTLRNHSTAISAVIRTKGNSKALTSAERAVFHDVNSYNFSQAMFDGYVNAIWDKQHNRPYKFGTVVMQMYYKHGHGDVTEETVTNSMKKIMKALNSPNTTYVLNVTMANLRKGGYKTFVSEQKSLDAVGKQAVKNVKQSMKGKYKELLLAPTGRAFCNYLLKYGQNYMQTKEPASYELYERNLGIANDLLYGDKLHSTHLGSYMNAMTLYSTMYGNPKNTVSYRGGVNTYIRLLNGERPNETNFAKVYNNGKGIVSDIVQNAVVSTVWNTVKNNTHEAWSTAVTSQQKALNSTPVLKSVTALNGAIKVKWNAVKEIVRYRVYRKVNGGAWQYAGTSQSLSFYDWNVQKGNYYTYTVRGVDFDNQVHLTSYNTVGWTVRY